MALKSDIPLYKTDDYSSLNQIEEAIAVNLKEKGYAILESMFDDDLLDRVVLECQSEYNNDSKYNNQNRRVADGWRSMESVSEVACDQRIITLLSKIYGKRAFPFQTLNFERGTEQRLHSDTIHFNSIPNLFMTGVWVALEDVTLDNGPLAYIENSHKLPVFNCDSAGIRSVSSKEDPYLNYGDYEDFVEEMVKSISKGPKLVQMKKGDVFIWSANLIHGGSPIIKEDSSRFSQVTHYFYDDCVYFTPLSSNLRDAKVHLRLPEDISTKSRTSMWKLIASMKVYGFSATSILRSLIYSKLGI